MSRDTNTTWAVTSCSLAYATVRYNVFKGVPWTDWPVYILNKALALSSLLILLIWVMRTRRSPNESASRLPRVASRLVLVHAVLSLAILTPAYFPAFFLGDRLTWQAGVSVLIGVLAASGLHLTSRSHDPRPAVVLRFGVIAFMAGIHATLYGYASWSTPATWPGHLLPITLISFVAGVVALTAALRTLTRIGLPSWASRRPPGKA